jgi:hypothetical protein
MRYIFNKLLIVFLFFICPLIQESVPAKNYEGAQKKILRCPKFNYQRPEAGREVRGGGKRWQKLIS